MKVSVVTALPRGEASDYYPEQLQRARHLLDVFPNDNTKSCLPIMYDLNQSETWQDCPTRDSRRFISILYYGRFCQRQHKGREGFAQKLCLQQCWVWRQQWRWLIDESKHWECGFFLPTVDIFFTQSYVLPQKLSVSIPSCSLTPFDFTLLSPSLE